VKNKLLKIIVHWDQEGYSTSSFLLEMTQEEFDKIKGAHGHYLNLTESNPGAEKSCNIVSFMLGDRSPDNLKFARELDIDEKWVGKFKDSEAIKTALQQPIDGFLACGFAG